MQDKKKFEKYSCFYLISRKNTFKTACRFYKPLTLLLVKNFTLKKRCSVMSLSINLIWLPSFSDFPVIAGVS